MNFENISLKDADLMSILNTISSPVIVAKPIIENNSMKDFEVIFFNDACKANISNKLLKRTYFSEIKTLISPEVPWQDLADKAINNIQTEPISYYSELSKAYFKLQMKCTKNGYIVISLENITNEKNEDENLIKTAYVDMLTGLYNRNKFTEDVKQFFEKTQFNNSKLAFLLIDIDNMKNINDYSGHTKGDEILKTASDVLKSFSKNIIQTYRFGGDEFLILIKNCSSIDSIGNISDAIFESLNLEEIHFSGGLAIYPDDSTSPDDLLRFADIAMRQAKKEGKNRITTFKSDMQRSFIQKLNMQAKMMDAIENNDFYLVYQPQFDIQTGDLRGFEALMRWFDKELGNIGPAVFIPIAEESGLIITIGKWVFDTAFKTLKKWQKQYNFKGILSINISSLQIKQSNFIENVRELVVKHNIDPTTVEIEVTESLMIDNIEETVAKLKELTNMGFRISLDDFGTGYSSLNYLQVLPLDTLKIDKSFVNGLTAKDGVQANIVNAIISMVNKMGLKTIAEGVEDPNQLSILKDFNCNIVQGFLRGKPMPEANCDAYLAGNKDALLSIEMENKQKSLNN